MVLIPVKAVTVAEPPRISIEETITFVASLNRTHQWWSTEASVQQTVPTQRTSRRDEPGVPIGGRRSLARCARKGR
jgi:hypothetical protein